MILRRLTVRHWRGYRDEHTFAFDEGFNLLYGRNEAGKSTLFEALVRAFFTNHSSSARFVKAMQPVGSSLAPTVEVEFSAGGREYRLVKRFLSKASAELHTRDGGGWRLNHTSDEADREAIRIVQGTPSTSDKLENRGLTQALWTLQGEPALPKEQWTDVVKQGLGGLVDQAVQTPEERRILTAIDRAFFDVWTAAIGKAKAGSPLSQAEDELARRRAELAECQAKAERYEEHTARMQELIARQAELTAALRAREIELEQAREAAAGAEAFERELVEQERAAADAAHAAERVRTDLEAVQAAIAQADKLESERARAHAEAEVAEREASAARVRKEFHRGRWQSELTPARLAAEARRQALDDAERAREAGRRIGALRTHVTELGSLTEQLRAAERTVGGLQAPSDEEHQSFVRLTRDLGFAEASRAAQAIRVRFDLDAPRAIQSAPTVSRDGDEFLLTHAVTFEIEGVGRVHVRGGGDDVAALDQKLRALREERDGVYRRFGVDSDEALHARHLEAANLRREVERLDRDLRVLRKKETDPERELARLESSLAQLGAGAQSVAGEVAERTEDDIRALRDQAGAEAKRLTTEIEAAQKSEQAADAETDRLGQRAAEQRNAVAQLAARVEAERRAASQVLARYGDLDLLTHRADETTRTERTAAERLAQLQRDHDLKIRLPRRLLESAQRAHDTLAGEVTRAENDLRVQTELRRELRAAENQARLEELEAEIDRLERRVERLARDAQAIKRLKETVDAARRAQTAALVQPVATQVDRWLRMLNADYAGLGLNEELLPTDVRTARFEGESLPLESLSYGAQEQVTVLVRLAIALLLGRDERQLVVLDDRLVNADGHRMRVFCAQILPEVAERCQVILATCNDAQYAGVEGTRMQVPQDGRVALPV